jgi:hypothetical protein
MKLEEKKVVNEKGQLGAAQTGVLETYLADFSVLHRNARRSEFQEIGTTSRSPIAA